jgi:hypothetical protein
MNTIDGFDAALYQLEMKYELIPASVKFCIAKCTESNTIVDPLYEYHKAHCLTKGIATMAYHFFHGSVNVDAQIDNFLNHVGEVAGPYWCDIEQRSNDGMPQLEVMNRAIDFCTRLKNQTKREVGIYTSPGYWNSFWQIGRDRLPFYLWEAAWINAPYIAYKYPMPVLGFSPPKVWQYAVRTVWGDKVDCDWFLGTQVELDDFLNNVNVTPPVEPPLPTFPILPVATVITTAGLRIRTGPGDTYPVLKTLPYGSLVEVIRVVKSGVDDLWANVGHQQFMAYKYHGSYLMKFE